MYIICVVQSDCSGSYLLGLFELQRLMRHFIRNAYFHTLIYHGTDVLFNAVDHSCSMACDSTLGGRSGNQYTTCRKSFCGCSSP